MRALLAALLLLPLSAARVAADDDGYDEVPSLQRYLADLQLGDSLEDVQRIYPPSQDWPSHIDPRGRVKRYRVERDWAKYFPAWTQAMMLGFKHGRLVDIQIIYNKKRSGEKTYEELAGDLSLTYGEARRTGDKFWWQDFRTVLRVFPVEVPTFVDGVNGTEWRTSMQVMDKGVYKSLD